jgi:hypothetical protein
MNRYKNGILEEAIRNIVNDVLEERFFGKQTQTKATSEAMVGGTITRRKRRRRRAVKGRVTDPTKDRRLKENRKIAKAE